LTLRLKHREMAKQQTRKRKSRVFLIAVFVEHRIVQSKYFELLKKDFDSILKKYERVILTICGLVRFRIER